MTSKFQKSQYYVWYLGWRECGGVYGRAITEPIVKELVRERQGDDLPKLTIEVTRKELKVVQLQEKRKNKTERIKYPPVPSKDVTYAVQAMPPDEDVVACIYLGFNSQTQRAVHVHVYRCDSRETAAVLVGHLNQLITLPEHLERVKKIEAELAAQGQITLRPDTYVPRAVHAPVLTEDLVSSDDGRNSDYSDSPRNQTEPTSPPFHLPFNGDETSSEMYDSLAEELKRKLKGGKDAPILLPAKDYDTVHRIKGNPQERDRRMSNHPAIVGKIAVGQPYEQDAEDRTAAFPISSHSDSRGHGSVESPRSPLGSRGKSSGSGGSPGSPRRGSRGMSSGTQESPNSPRGSGNNVLGSSGGSSGAVFRGETEGHEADLLPVSPRWKTSGHAVFKPPTGEQNPRRHNSEHRTSASGGAYKEPSPVWPPPLKSKAFSPGPHTKDLKKKSYFPSSGLPNYMRGNSGENGAQYPPDARHEKGHRDQAQSGKKYTATSLGLTDGKPAYATSDPRRDRGAQQRAQYPPPENRYLSLDRREVHSYHADGRGQPQPRAYVIDDPRGGYPSNHVTTGHQPTRTASFNY